MNMIKVLFLIGAFIFLIIIFNVAEANTRPNIVLIMVDDLSPIEDQKQPEAPNLYANLKHYPSINELAKTGMRFRTMYATPVCTSSRVELMTGLYGYNNGYYNFWHREYAPKVTSPYYDIANKYTFADMLKTKGYTTGIVGKWQLPGDPHDGRFVYSSGFDDYLVWLGTGVISKYFPGKSTSRYWSPLLIDNGTPIDTSGYGPKLFIDWAKSYITAHADEPFLLYYPMVLAHVPYEPVPNPDNGMKIVPGNLKSYVKYIDYAVGEITDHIESLGLRDNTIIIFTADNGSAWVDSHGNTIKNTPTEKGARVPFIVSMPGTVASNTASRQITDFVDIYATLDDYSGNAIDGSPQLNIDGVSLRDVLGDATQSGWELPQTSHKSWIHSYIRNKRIIRNDRYVYQDINESGDGSFYDCGTRRNIDWCELTNNLPMDVYYQFMREVFRMPLPDIYGQELIQ